MLVLRVHTSANYPRFSTIRVFRVEQESESLITTYEAEGSLQPGTRTLSNHQIILNDAFNSHDVALFGRYGIIQFSGEGTDGEDLSISGGQRSALESALLPRNLLRLTRDDHRHLRFLLRSSHIAIAEIHVEPGAEQISSPLVNVEPGIVGSRLAYILSAAAATPFVFASSAAAQATGGSGGSGGQNPGAPGVKQSVIQQQEGGVFKGGGTSGVTINGLDLGHQTASSLRSFGFSPAQINYLSPFLGKTGSAAVSAFNAHPSVKNPPSAIVSQIYNVVYPTYIQACATSFNQLGAQQGLQFNFASMPSVWQTVTASMYFQGASATPGTSQKFMKTQFASLIVHGNYSSAVTILQNFNSPSGPQNTRAAANYSYLKSQGAVPPPK